MPFIPPDDPLFRHDYLRVHNLKIHFVTAGQGEPVLLWHGFLSSWYSWRKVIPLLADRYTVIAPDMRGFGDSDKHPTDCDALRLAEDFRAVVRELGFKRLRVAAHGIGAPGALLWAARYPDEISHLAYIDAPLLTERAIDPLFRFRPEVLERGGLGWWIFALSPEIPEQLITGREREFLGWFHRHFATRRDAVEEAEREYLRTFHGRDSVRGALAVLRAVFYSMKQTEDATQKRIQCPLMAVGAANGLGESVREAMQTVGGNVTGCVIPDCGHFVPEEQPELLAGRLESFFISS